MQGKFKTNAIKTLAVFMMLSMYMCVFIISNMNHPK